MRLNPATPGHPPRRRRRRPPRGGRCFAAARSGALGFRYADGRARACFGTRAVQKTHVARLKFPARGTIGDYLEPSGEEDLVVRPLLAGLHVHVQLARFLRESARISLYAENKARLPEPISLRSPQ
jgi:hypothetical protein